LGLKIGFMLFVVSAFRASADGIAEAVAQIISAQFRLASSLNEIE
jgi:hypothetical protein